MPVYRSVTLDANFFDTIKGLILSVVRRCKANALDLSRRTGRKAEGLGQWGCDERHTPDVWEVLFVREGVPLLALTLATSPPYGGCARIGEAGYLLGATYAGAAPHGFTEMMDRIDEKLPQEEALPVPKFSEAGWTITTRVGENVQEFTGTVFDIAKLDEAFDAIVHALAPAPAKPKET